MGIFQWLRSSAEPPADLFDELAELAGRNQGLVERLNRHADICVYPNIKVGVHAIAAREAAHVKTLDAILSDHHRWAKLPEAPLHDGSNNWARLSGDLALLQSLLTDLRLAVAKWESEDEKIANTLMQLAIEDDDQEVELRKLALKCDALALD